jgi:hypothetical protein
MSEEIAALLRQLEAGELGEPLAVLAYVAGRQVDVPETELNAARRRALLLLAAGGDLHREVGVDDRAVKALATDLFTEERRRALGAAVDELAVSARDLPRVREAALYLAREGHLAWRLFSLGLLAEELDEEE